MTLFRFALAIIAALVVGTSLAEETTVPQALGAFGVCNDTRSILLNQADQLGAKLGAAFAEIERLKAALCKADDKQCEKAH